MPKYIDYEAWSRIKKTLGGSTLDEIIKMTPDKTGVAIGKDAELSSTFDVQLDAIFRGDTSLQALTAVSANIPTITTATLTIGGKKPVTQKSNMNVSLNDDSGYLGFTNAPGNYLRTPSSGLIPNSTSSGGAIGTSAWQFTSGYIKTIYGNLKGKADYAGYLTDRNNGTASYLNYGAPNIASASYLAAWNGYELRAMTPTNVRNTISANALNRTVVTLWSGSVQSGKFSVSNMGRYRMLAVLLGSASSTYATWLIMPCISNTNQLRTVGAYNTSHIELYTTSGTRTASSITMTEGGRTTFYNNQYPTYTRLYFKQIVGIY